MIILVGLCSGLGVALWVWQWLVPEPVAWHAHLRRPLPRPPGFVRTGLLWGGATMVVVWFFHPGLALVTGVLVGVTPRLIHQAQQVSARQSRADAWPDAVDHIASAVRAGMALPEALGRLGTSGPEVLRPAFTQFERDYRATGRLTDALAALQDSLQDPAADRVCAVVRLTRDVGGADIGTVLNAQSEFMRAEARTRAEIVAKQSWSLHAARLAVAAPWVVLLMMLTRPEGWAAYRTSTGATLIAVAMIACVVAYRLMSQIARLPEAKRVLG